jgi:hypothetical protein
MTDNGLATAAAHGRGLRDRVHAVCNDNRHAGLAVIVHGSKLLKTKC